MRKTTHVQLFVFIFLVMTGLTTTLKAQGEESAYYYVGDKKISLSVPENFKAFSMKSSISPSNREGFEATVRSAGVGNVEHSPIIEQYGLVVIRAKDSIGTSAFRSGMEALSHRQEVAAETPVYAIGKTSAVLINEFLVQFQEAFSESSINTFLANHQATVVNKHDKIPNRYTIMFDGKSPKEALALCNVLHQDSHEIFSEPNLLEIVPA